MHSGAERGRETKGDQNQLANSGEVSKGKKRRHSKTSSNVLGEENIGAGVQCMASLGLKKYPGTSGGKKARNGTTCKCNILYGVHCNCTHMLY